MANRTIEQKKMKMKRRNRHAIFSGATSKYAVRIDRGRFDVDGHHVKIRVGPISLSKQVMSTGRGPDKEKMQEYYERLHSYDVNLPETLGLTEPLKEMKAFELTKKYTEFILGVPKEFRINYVRDDIASLDLFFSGQQFFWVEVNFQKKFWRRSCIYRSKRLAETFMQVGKITWVETITSPRP